MDIYSDIANMFLAQKRTKIQTYRGSLLNTSIHSDNADQWCMGKAGSVLYLAPISYNASINSFRIAFTHNVKELEFSVGICGINRDRSFSLISPNVIGTVTGATFGGTIREILLGSRWGKTIGELLNIYSKNEFKIYENSKYGMLVLVLTRQEITNSPKGVHVSIDYVDGNSNLYH